MIIFGTKCLFCGKVQLATEDLIGLNVRCSECLREFVCLDETGALPFVQSVGVGTTVQFEKKITAAFFTYGIGIPTSMHDIIRSRLSKSLSLGDVKPAILRVDGIDFPIRVRRFQNYRKEICLHLLWLSGSGLKGKLSEEYPDAYLHYVEGRGTEGRTNWKVTVSVSTEEDVFVLDEAKHCATSVRKILMKKDSFKTTRKTDLEFLDSLLK